MKILFSCILCFCCSFVYGQWNSMGLSVENREYDGHNLGEGKYDNPTTILIQINGQDIPDISLSEKLGYYIVGYYPFKSTFWFYETVGDIRITNSPVQDDGNSISGTTVEFEEMPVDNIHTKPDQWGTWETVGFIFDWWDFASGDAIVEDGGYWEVVIVNKESGYCVSSGRIQYQQEVKLNLVDPTLGEPSNVPVLEVQDLPAICWTEGGTVDLSKAIKNVTPEDATVTYYSNAECTDVITNPKAVAMGDNPTSAGRETSYWVKASNADGESDAKEFKVRVDQTPVVTLSANVLSPVCSGTEVTLTAENGNEFVAKSYEFFNSSVPLASEIDGQYVIADMLASGTYTVKVTTSAGCDATSAPLVLEVSPAVPSGAIKLDVTKNEICAGEEVTLTASLNDPKGDYAGAVFKWSTGSGDDGKTEITVTPESTTKYTVTAELNGCPATVGDGREVTITVNPLPVLELKKPQNAYCEGGKYDLTAGVVGVASGSEPVTEYKYCTESSLETHVKTPKAVEVGTYYVTGSTAKGCWAKTPIEVVVTENPAPQPKILVDDNEFSEEGICSGQEVKLSADKNYNTCNWTGGVTTTGKETQATISEGKTNSFSLTVTDANGCEGSASLDIEGWKVPTVSIDPVEAACAGSDITLTAQIDWKGEADGTIKWTGNHKADATVDAATLSDTLARGGNTYTVTVTAGNTCSASEEVTVTGNYFVITPTVSPNVVDEIGEQVTLNVTAKWNGSAALGADDAKYAWYKVNPEPRESLGNSKQVKDTPTEATTYMVTVEKEGCVDSARTNVTVDFDKLELVDGIQDAGETICEGSEFADQPLKFYVTAKGGIPGYKYTWTLPEGITAVDGVTDSDTLLIESIDYAQVTGSFTISVKVTDSKSEGGANTVDAKKTISIQALPEVQIDGQSDGATLLACQDANTTLTASAKGILSDITWSWTGFDNPHSALTIPTSETGIQKYTAVANYKGCVDSATVSVTVNGLPELALEAIQDGESVSNVCKDSEITLQATVKGVESPELVWSNGYDGSSPLPVKERTTYSVSYTDKKTTCTAKQSIVVAPWPEVTLTIAAEPDGAVCAGEQVVLTANGGTAYVWSGGEAEGPEASVTVRPSATTEYTVTGEDEHGCVAKAGSYTINVTDAPTLELATSTLPLCEGGSVDLADAVNTETSTPGTLMAKKSTEGDDAWQEVAEMGEVTEPGSYNLRMDGGTGCSSQVKTVTVESHAAPVAELAANVAEQCSGETIILTATPEEEGVTYTYEGKAGNKWEVTVSNAGLEPENQDFKVIATNAAGCTSELTATVSVKPLPDIKVWVDGVETVQVCAEKEVTLRATGADSYTWSGGEQGPEEEPTYTVIPNKGYNQFQVTGVKDGCAVTKDINLDVLDAPEFVVNNLQGCVGAEINLAKAVSGYGENPPLFYSDKELQNIVPVTLMNISWEGDSIFYAVATNGSCETVKEVIVTGQTLPHITIDGNDPVCAGEELTLKATVSGVVNTYQWTKVGEGVIGTKAQITINPAQTTDYELSVTDATPLHCTKKTTFTVTVNPLPELRWHDNYPTMEQGESKTFSVALKEETKPEYTYTWVRNDVVDENSAGSYSLSAEIIPEERLAVSVVDGNGCVSDTLKTTITVLPQGGALAVALSAASTEICRNGMQLLTAKAVGGVRPYSYQWMKDNTPLGEPTTDSLWIATEAGNYKVVVTTADDGQTAESKVLTMTTTDKNAPVVSVIDQKIERGTSTVLLAEITPMTAGDSYLWSGKLLAGEEGKLYPRTENLNRDEKFALIVKTVEGCYSKPDTGIVEVTDEDVFTVLAEVDSKVCVGSETYLTAIISGEPVGDVTYRWIPETNLTGADSERPLFDPSGLNGEQIYAVLVTDENGNTAVDTVKFEVSSDVAPVLELTDPGSGLCQGTVIAVSGTGISDIHWQFDGGSWMAGEASVNTLSAGERVVRVYAVADNGCPVDTVEATYTIHALPELAWKNVPESFVAGDPLTVEVEVKNASDAPAPYKYAWTTEPENAGTASDETYTIASTVEENYRFKVSVTDDHGCVSEMIDTIVREEGSTIPVKIDAKGDELCAVPAGETVLADLSVSVLAGPANLKYTWTTEEEGLAIQDADKPTAHVNVAGVDAGTYSFTVTVEEEGNPENKETATVEIVIEAVPVVNFADESCLALHSDSTATLTVASASDEYKYIWVESVKFPSSPEWSDPETLGTNASALDVTMADKDFLYQVIAEAQTGLKCRSIPDSAYVYRIPNKVSASIDTVKGKPLAIQIDWGTDNVADDYTVWSRKWDPYCMTSVDGGVYEEAARQTGSSWAETEMDTLEFYYVTANRNVCGTTYHSFSSDTLGYYLFDVKKNVEGKASNNHMAMYFDMSRDGQQYMAKDILQTLPLMYVRYWDYEIQRWNFARLIGNNCAGDFEIKPGMLLQMEPTGEAQYLQYGKLPPKMSLTVLNTNTEIGNLSNTYMWLHRLDLQDAHSLFNEFPDKIYYIRYWDFAKQMWVFARMIGSNCAGNFDLKPLLPLQFELNKGVPSIVWE